MAALRTWSVAGLVAGSLASGFALGVAAGRGPLAAKKADGSERRASAAPVTNVPARVVWREYGGRLIGLSRRFVVVDQSMGRMSIPRRELEEILYPWFLDGEADDEGSVSDYDADAAVRRAAARLLDAFCALWRDPHPVKGFAWNAQVETGELRNALLRITQGRDWRGRQTSGVLKTYLENSRLSPHLRDCLFGMFEEIRPRAEMRYFRRQLENGSDPWLRRAALRYLAANRDSHALALEVDRALTAQSTEERMSALYSVSAFFGDEVEFEVPSESWGILYKDGYGFHEEVARLTGDVRAWWEEHRAEYVN